MTPSFLALRRAELVEAAPRARSARIRSAQAAAWMAHGGTEHYEGIGESLVELGEALTAAAKQPDNDGKINWRRRSSATSAARWPGGPTTPWPTSPYPTRTSEKCGPRRWPQFLAKAVPAGTR